MTPEELAKASGARIDRARASLFLHQAYKCLLQRYATSSALVDALLMHAKRPASRAHADVADAIQRDRNKGSLVLLALFCFGRPSNISRLIVPVFIHPIKRMFGGWLRSHVGKKDNEVTPCFMESNAAPTIAIPMPAIWIQTPLAHCRPTHVLGGLFVPVGMPMFANLFHRLVDKSAAERCHPFICQTAARLSLPGLEFARHRNLRVAA